MTPARRRMITFSIMVATIMQTLDSTIANVALPHMQGSLSASQDQIAWVLTAYIVASAIATPLTGWMVDRFGQKQVFLVSVIGFTLASGMCGIANTLAQIVAARLAQGVCGAALAPLSQLVLMEINPPEKQGSAMAVWGMGVMVGPILGPSLGGVLTDSYGWRWVFFINLPIGIMATYGIWKYIDRVPAVRRQRFDVFGFATLSMAVGALQLLLDRGQTNDWYNSTETWIETAIMVVAFTYFVAHTATTPAERSFLDYRLLKNRNYWAGLILIFIVGLVIFATRALTPTMLQSLFDYPVQTAGLVIAPAGLGSMFAMMIAGRLSGKVDVRLLLFVGFIAAAVSLWMMTDYSLDISARDIIWPGVLQGIGTGLIFVPLSSATFGTLAPHMRAQGTGIFSLSRNIGSSIGISMVQTLLTRHAAIAHANLVEHLTYANPAWTDPAVQRAYDVTRPASAAALNALVDRQSDMIGYLFDYRLMLYLTLAFVPLLLLIRRPKTAAIPDAHAVMD